MDSPPLTVKELLDENRRLRDQHAKEIAEQAQTLRDEFAKAALPAVYAHESTGESPGSKLYVDPKALAHTTYEIADAMLAERTTRLKAVPA